MSIYGKPILLGDPAPSIAYESIDQWQIKTLNGLSKTDYTNHNNSGITVNKLSDSAFFHIYGTFNNGNADRHGWFISRDVAESFIGKYLNFKIEGTYTGNFLFNGTLTVNVSPWNNMAVTNPTQRKCLISAVSGSYSQVIFRIDVGWDAQAGDTIDAYVELTITDD